MDSGPGKSLVTVAFGRIQEARAFWGPHSKDQNILGYMKGARFWEPPYVVPNSHGEPYCVAMIPRPQHRPLSATMDHRFMCGRVRRFGVTRLVQLQWTAVLNGHFWGLDVSLGEGMLALLFPLYMASRCPCVPWNTKIHPDRHALIKPNTPSGSLFAGRGHVKLSHPSSARPPNTSKDPNSLFLDRPPIPPAKSEPAQLEMPQGRPRLQQHYRYEDPKFISRISTSRRAAVG